MLPGISPLRSLRGTMTIRSGSLSANAGMVSVHVSPPLSVTRSVRSVPSFRYSPAALRLSSFPKLTLPGAGRSSGSGYSSENAASPVSPVFSSTGADSATDGEAAEFSFVFGSAQLPNKEKTRIAISGIIR